MKRINLIIKKSLHYLFFKFLKIISKRRASYSDHRNSIELTYLKQSSDNVFREQFLLGLLARVLDLYPARNYIFPRRNGTDWDMHNICYLGEHYRLLPVIADVCQARKICEIGTYLGASTASMIDNTSANVITFDLISWRDFEDTYLKQSDFDSGRVTQKLCDLSDPIEFEALKSDLLGCDLFFVDGPKDGVFEEKFLELIYKNEQLFAGKLFVFDDIRLSTMVSIWNSIKYPKIDISFIGHWSGTGIFVCEAK